MSHSPFAAKFTPGTRFAREFGRPLGAAINRQITPSIASSSSAPPTIRSASSPTPIRVRHPERHLGVNYRF
ncbi:hypothetical protein OV203_33285 [Nannocystis sp. ILAH1]|uniref:hypothetical protein n=1 Tax=unclassified Nannocystis TaxID=2627009 RepID=UPI00226EA8A3|nr:MULTISPECIES: hypothetical protein [unclassified Nannocystis]MCY0992060.1 hypothetical protein [Nannocystis sp. ILAH1]MCY1064311.1 hypothetical protein [Nannocystis sp. RBIL2]